VKREARIIANSLILLLALSFIIAATGFCQEYEGLKGVKSVKAVFDVRISNPKSAALHLKLIQDTFKDKNLMSITKKPAFAVVFIGPSVKLISKNREGFSAEDQKSLDEIAGTVSAMAKSGIRLEICLVAAQVFGVDPASVLPGIKHVPNGWVSLIGYQAKGYSLVPAY
jgi:intracellular sulfur oxidation DsrE/DsrF family protein